MKSLIKQLVETYGPSGFEDDVRAAIRQHVEPLADDIEVDAMGNLFALKRGDGSGRRIMVAAHMDEIGLIITQVEDAGFLRFSGIGTIPPKALLGTRVRFANGVIGVISHDGGAMEEIAGKEIPDMGQWFIDVGAGSKDELTVGVGDIAAFVRPFDDLGQRLLGGGFDDRIGCAALIETMKRLERSPHDVIFTFTVQEEVGVRGARVAAFGREPDIGLAVDVAPTGDTPHAKRAIALKLGGGAAIKVADAGMISHPRVRRAMERVAQAHDIPYQLEVLPFGSTDAMAMQATRSGVMTGAISIPSRYTHLTAEMIDLEDVENVVRLLTAYLADPDPA